MGLISSSPYFAYSSGAGGAQMTPEEAILNQRRLSQQNNNGTGTAKTADGDGAAGPSAQGSTAAQSSPSTASSNTPNSNKIAAKNVLPLLGNGRYEVGCADIMVCSQPGEEGAGILARVFYPSTTAVRCSQGGEVESSNTGDTQVSMNNVEKREYMHWKMDPDYVDGLARYRDMSVGKLNFFLDWIVGDKRIPVYWQTPMAPGTDKFPVIIFSHGISGNRFIYATICASLASHGFIVSALEHRDGSSCWTFSLEKADTAAGEENGEPQQMAKKAPPLVRKPIEMIKLPHEEEEYELRINQVKRRVSETVRMRAIFAKLNAGQMDEQIVLGQDFDWTQFRDRVDLARAVSMGHSFGGASALWSACVRQQEFACCVILDGWLYPFERTLYANIGRLPVLMLAVSKWQWARNIKRLQHVLRQGDGACKLMFTLKDIVHQSFSDFGFLVPGMVGRYFGVQGDLDPALTGTAILELILGFLRDPEHASNTLRALVAEKYAHFVLEGTDMSREQLEGIDEAEAESASAATGAEEERKVAKDADVEQEEEDHTQ